MNASPTAPSPRSTSPMRRYWWGIFGAMCVAIVILASKFASSDPDGLEKVAEDKGFLDEGKGSNYEWLPDYTVPGVDGTLSTVMAGVIGLVIVFTLMWVLGKVVARRRA